jgi:hypothetical protein
MTILMSVCIQQLRALGPAFLTTITVNAHWTNAKNRHEDT